MVFREKTVEVPESFIAKLMTVVFLQNELNDKNTSYRAKEMIKEKLAKIVPSTVYNKIPLRRVDYLRVAREFDNIGMEKEAQKYAKKALGGIKTKLISGMSEEDRKYANQILGKEI